MATLAVAHHPWHFRCLGHRGRHSIRGAWNASIIAETVSWGNTTLTAYGLGVYIASATKEGDWPRIALGVGFMCVFVVGLNRCVWRRLYHLAETRYRLGS